MKSLIDNIWIESEERGSILDGSQKANDNSDVIVTFRDKSRYVATFFSYQNIEHLRRKNQETGECLKGRYFWASDMILIESLNRKEIETIIEHLLKEDEFPLIFREIEED
ncbi:hypothetical protein [Croceimicrobium sp.]|uniref:hypothetical protein n=1 Tax=Croceimicrobium sp. TaxID=2828340 RepID=UPI003BAD1D95